MKKVFLVLFLILSLTFVACGFSDNFSKDSDLVAISYDVLSEDAEFYLLEFRPDFENEILNFSLHGLKSDDEGQIGGELYELAADTFGDFACTDFDETDHSGSDFVLTVNFVENDCSFSFAMDNESFGDVLNFYTEFVNYVTSEQF